MKIEKRHAKDRSKVRARQEECAHQRYGLHGCAVPLARMCDATLLPGDFEVESCLSLRHDVIKLFERQDKKIILAKAQIHKGGKRKEKKNQEHFLPLLAALSISPA